MTEEPEAIVLVPQRLLLNVRLADKPLDKLIWISGQPEKHPGGTIKDLGPDAHVLTFPTHNLMLYRWGKIRARVSLIIEEPTSVHGRYYWWLILLQWRFFRVLSREAGKHALIRNMRFFQQAWRWVADRSDYGIEKTKTLSIIASKQNKIEGHKMRHRLVDWLRTEQIDADILGRAYKPLDDKADGLAPYRFSLIIENTREPHYHTEKIIDAMLCRTVPIYWGDPVIGQYFDERGMIIATNEEAIREAVLAADTGGYERRREAVEENYRRAKAILEPQRVKTNILGALRS